MIQLGHFCKYRSVPGLAFRYDAGATEEMFIADTMGGGVGLLDFDDDGWLDVYFVNGCRLPIDPAEPPAPNKLFRNRGDGTFQEIGRKYPTAPASVKSGIDRETKRNGC